MNFIPAWYVEARRRRVRFHRQCGLVVVLLAALAGLISQSLHSRGALAQYHAALAEQLATTQRQVTEVQKLERDKTELARQIRIHRELHQPINYSQITGTLAALMPEAVAMRAVNVKTEKLTSTRPMTAAELAAAKAATGRVARPTVSETRSVVRLEVDGIAPSDVDVANFVGAVAASNLFRSVKMLYSRQGTHRQQPIREFRIRMEVPLDVEYRPAAGSEVVRAS